MRGRGEQKKENANRPTTMKEEQISEIGIIRVRYGACYAKFLTLLREEVVVLRGKIGLNR